MIYVYPMRVRIRLPELLDEHKITAYEVAKRSAGRIIPSTLYRLVRQGGRVKLFDGDLLEALCDVLDLEPGELLEREKKSKGRRS
jgi:DNA-binding Xre family transcriptional regulator